MNERIKLIIAKNKRRRELEAQDLTEEDIEKNLEKEGYTDNTVKKESSSTEEKAWCHICKEKVTVKFPNIVKKEIKKGSYRRFLTGECINCSHNVSTLVKVVERTGKTEDFNGENS